MGVNRILASGGKLLVKVIKSPIGVKQKKTTDCIHGNALLSDCAPIRHASRKAVENHRFTPRYVALTFSIL
jgi:hypothetical protein